MRIVHRTTRGITTEYSRTVQDLARFEENVGPGKFHIDVVFDNPAELDVYVNMASMVFKSIKHWRPYLGHSTVAAVDLPPVIFRKMSRARIDAACDAGRGASPNTESQALNRAVALYTPCVGVIESSQTESSITLTFDVVSSSKAHGAAIFARIANTAKLVAEFTQAGHRFVSNARMLKATWEDISLMCRPIATG